jgi:predicted ATPase/DNA-binding SARP family transcriptional activator
LEDVTTTTLVHQPVLRLLGPVRIDTNPPTRQVSGAKARAVLAALGLRVGQVVTLDQLIEDVWGETPPPTARNAIQVYISALRRTYDLSGRVLGLERVADGYRLRCARGEVDWWLFQELAAQSRRSARDGDLERAAGLLVDALRLWDGPPLADIGSAALAATFAAGMEAARQSALADRIDADLALGRPNLVAELAALVASHPLDERFAVQLMQAHWYAGHRPQALAAYTDLRRRIVAELGLEPGSRARDVQRAILDDARPATPVPSATVTVQPVIDRWPGRFIGRSADLKELTTLLGSGQLVTLTGPPGVGKSRLAAEFARRASLQTDAVAMVQLDEVGAGTGVAQAVVEALGGGVPARRDAVEHARGQLLGRAVLLIVDNCERVVSDVAGLVEQLRVGRPGLRILATGRQPLSVRDEVVYRLAPLGIPDETVTDLADMLRSEAVRLFCERARERRPTFEPSAENAPAIAAICRATEGLPLAIELASARTAVLSSQELAALLAHRPDLLSGRDSLGAAIAASCDRLTAAERTVFARLSCFRAGFTLPAAEAVAFTAVPTAGFLLDSVQRLVDESLLTAELSDAETRFRILEPLRRYGRQLLDEATAADVLQRHARYYADLVCTAAGERRGPRRQYWRHRLDTERPNLEAAIEWALRHGDTRIAVGLVADLWWVWVNTPRAGIGWYRRVIAAARADTAIAGVDLLPALLSAAVIASYLSNAEAMEYAEAAHEFATAIGDSQSTVRALQHISDIAYEQGDLSRAVSTGTEAVKLAAGLEDPYALGRCQLTVAYNHLAHLDLDDVHDWAERAVRSFRANDDEAALADARLVLAEAAVLAGDGAHAELVLARIRQVFRNTGSDEHFARAGTLLAWVLSAAGSRADAAGLIREAFDVHLVVGHSWSIAHDLDIVAAMAAGNGEYLLAAALLAAAAMVRADAGLAPLPRDVALRDRVANQCRTALGDAVFRSAAREGAAMDLDAAVGLARAVR